MVSFGLGAGSDAFSIRVTERIARRRDLAPLTRDLSRAVSRSNYATYRALQAQVADEVTG